MNELDQLQESLLREANSTLVGREMEVLVDGYKKGKWQGRTRTDKLVFFPDERDWLGQTVSIKIQQTSPWALQGTSVID
jgi:tRNA-2-methylthio-N6-dimethylallyladenosine synthase